MTSTTTPPAGPPVPRLRALRDEVFAAADAVAPDRTLTLSVGVRVRIAGEELAARPTPALVEGDAARLPARAVPPRRAPRRPARRGRREGAADRALHVAADAGAARAHRARREGAGGIRRSGHADQGRCGARAHGLEGRAAALWTTSTSRSRARWPRR